MDQGVHGPLTVELLPLMSTPLGNLPDDSGNSE